MNIYITKHGSGRPIVFLHGWGFDSRVWFSLLEVFQKKNQVFLVDLPGFGKTPNMEWDEFKNNLLTALPEKFALIGWSMGGLIATRLCIEEPLRVEKLINVASSPYFIQDEGWHGVDEKILHNFYMKLAEDPVRTRVDFIKSQLKTVVVPENILSSNESSIIGLRRGLDILLTWDLRSQLLELKQPVLYVFGRLDSIVPIKLMPIMQELYPKFDYVVFKKDAHAMFLSQPLAFAETINEFVK